MTEILTPLEALEAIVPDLEEKDYIASMIEEENPKDFDSLWDLIGDFLEESDEKNAKTLCTNILDRLVDKSAEESTTGYFLLERLFMLGIEEIQFLNRFYLENCPCFFKTILESRPN